MTVIEGTTARWGRLPGVPAPPAAHPRLVRAVHVL